MKKFGIDKQILSLPGPTLDDLPSNIPTEGFNKIYMAANDGIAKIAEDSHGRFKGIATVSLLDVEEAVEETERSVKDLGLLGVQVLSNVRGRPLDSPEFEPFYSKVSQLGCGLWIHPSYIRTIYDWMNDDYNMKHDDGLGDRHCSCNIPYFSEAASWREHPDLKLSLSSWNAYTVNGREELMAS